MDSRLDAVSSRVGESDISSISNKCKKSKSRSTRVRDSLRREKYLNSKHEESQMQINQIGEYFAHQKPPNDLLSRIACKESCYADAIDKYVLLKEGLITGSMKFEDLLTDVEDLNLISKEQEDSRIQNIIIQDEVLEKDLRANFSESLVRTMSHSQGKTQNKMKVSTAIITWLQQATAFSKNIGEDE